jgi:ParB family transcriptional regulator, chromosome partitioning protein
LNEQQVESIPISEIRIINPRSRNRIKWQLVVQSIATVGLKRPITVAQRPQSASDGKRYDLVCGQGRMEAFVELGEMFIPAIIIEAPEQDLTCLDFLNHS